MDPVEARRLAQAGEVVLVDVRNPDEWHRTGVGEGAVPISMQDPAFLDKLMEALGGDAGRPVAVICAAGGRSAQVAAALRARGFGTVHNVAEGMMGSAAGPGWLGRGLPVTPWA
ncbi:rhodanese-like domain-containing protein [Prosthecomicrobium sp. N25]|uniref:rhodanese-like domain-containing protein n=1 Tax=Prosthecomicrobium sp. N25 TaxID=3129254 RepID=UPI0030783E63